MTEPQLSEEEIKKRIELMRQNCPFCKIVKKEIPAKTVFEDDICMAILDINPAANGHLLLFPKEHYMMMPMVPDEVLGHLSIISKYLCNLLKESFNYDNVDIFIANGAAAGQQAQHFLIHVIPKTKEIEIKFDLKGEKLNDLELEDLNNKLKQKLVNLNKNN